MKIRPPPGDDFGNEGGDQKGDSENEKLPDAPFPNASSSIDVLIKPIIYRFNFISSKAAYSEGTF